MRRNGFDYEGYIAIKEVAAYLSIKIKTLYAIVGSGKVPHYKIGRLLRFKKEEIDSWMEGNRADKKEDDKIPVENPRRGGRQRKCPTRDIDRRIKKTIDQEKREEYTSSCGKSAQIEDLGKEVEHGSI